MLERGWRPLVRRAGRLYLAGPELADALEECRRLEPLTERTTIGYWSPRDAQPDDVARACFAAVDSLAVGGHDCYLSAKAPAMGMREDLIGELGERAARQGVRLLFDAEGADDADATYALVGRLRDGGADVGCALAGRWTRSLRDADWAAERGVPVRVVKGERPDRAGGSVRLRQGFMAVVDRLAGRATRVSVATRDLRLARAALDRLQAAGTACDIEMVRGLAPQRMFDLARARGVAVRLYVPYGVPQLPFSLTQFVQNPRVLWWLGRALAARDPSRELTR